jgi:V8-like Glu-specific endopeptidase
MLRILLLVLVVAFNHSAFVYGQSSTSQKDIEELKRTLEEIITKDQNAASSAKRALADLEKPENTQEGYQARNRSELDARRIVNGIPVRGHPAVGALLIGNDPKTAKINCTGTLVGCDKFLTAAHCIAKNPSPAGYVVFFQEAGFFRVRDIKWEPKQYKVPLFDIAMLTLEKPVQGIAPMPVNFTLDAPLDGEIATIVGFGRTGGINYDYGIKRDGSVKKRACPPAYDGKKVLCWFFDADVKSTDSASNTCHADSGGGIFIRDDDGKGATVRKVFAVVSGGEDNSCNKKDVSFNVDVYQYRDWIASTGEGRLSSRACGQPVGEDGVFAPKQEKFHLDENTTKASVIWTVPPSVKSLRITMNGADDGSGTNDFDLLVFDEKSSEPRCKEDGGGQYAFCEILSPNPGNFRIQLIRNKGRGDAQVTATFVPG